MQYMQHFLVIYHAPTTYQPWPYIPHELSSKTNRKSPNSIHQIDMVYNLEALERRILCLREGEGWKVIKALF